MKEEVEKAEEAGQEVILGALREEELLVGIRDQIWGVQNGGRRICISQIPFRTNWRSRNSIDKRARNEASQQAIKRRKANNEEDSTPIYASPFSKEEIEAEEKKPKRKVAVLIGYSGTGYKGMQMWAPTLHVFWWRFADHK